MPPNHPCDVPALDPAVIDWVTRLFGQPDVMRLPEIDLTGDSTRGVVRLARDLRSVRVALFTGVSPAGLEALFRLRLLQIVRRRPVLDVLSVVLLADGDGTVAGGLGDRIRGAWPFARCLFLAERPEGFAARIGIPVGPIGSGAPEPLTLTPTAAPPIALVIQPIWRRCGSTTVFENQTASLVRAGSFVVRMFHDARTRRGPTLNSRLAGALPENQVNIGAHVNVASVPEGPWPLYAELKYDGYWAVQMAETAASTLRDTLVRTALRRADVSIANLLERVGLGMRLAPAARQVLEVHGDRVTVERQGALLRGMPHTEMEHLVDAAAAMQAKVLSLPDLVVHVSAADLRRLGPLSPRAALVTPRVYATTIIDPPPARFDILLVGDGHAFNMLSLHWFLTLVWKPYLEKSGVRAAIAGRSGQNIDRTEFASENLVFTGFINDLERFRAACTLTVIPDRGGTGIAVKMLTALAAGHPIVTTGPGLRGVEPAVFEGIPAHDHPLALAQDITALLSNPVLLEERRALVRAAYQRLLGRPDHAALLASVPPPDEATRRGGRVAWDCLVAKGILPEPVPFRFTLDNSFSLTGGPSDRTVLAGSWQEPEPWGRWTDGVEAGLNLELAAPTDDPLCLEMEISPSAVQAALTVLIDGTALPAIEPMPGANEWYLPNELTRGKSVFRITLRAERPFRPSDDGVSNDDRVLGMGVRTVRLRNKASTRLQVGERMPLTAERGLRNVLVAGWHGPEDWGTWTRAPDATLVMAFDEPLSGVMRLDLDLTPPPGGAPLTVSTDGERLPPAQPVVGLNRWLLPLAATEGKISLRIGLSVPEVVRPVDLGISGDDRSLGVGVRAIRLAPASLGIARVNQALALSSATPLRDTLLRGWHMPEAWGTWTSGAEAMLLLVFAEKLHGRHRLEMHLSPTRAGAMLTLTVAGVRLPPAMPVDGLNIWTLPPEALDGLKDVPVLLQVSQTWCPRDGGISEDARTLGVGVKSIGLFQEAEAAAWPIGPLLRVNSADGWRGIEPSGWHPLEAWGVWSASRSSSLHLRFGQPLGSSVLLLLDIVPLPVEQMMTVSVDGDALPPARLLNGINDWVLPGAATQGKTILAIDFTVDALFRPDAVGRSNDTRELGFGIRAIGIQSFD